MLDDSIGIQIEENGIPFSIGSESMSRGIDEATDNMWVEATINGGVSSQV